MVVAGRRRPPSSFENSAGLRVSDKGKSIAYVRSSSTALSMSGTVIIRTNVGITGKMRAVIVADDAHRSALQQSRWDAVVNKYLRFEVAPRT